MSCNSDIRSAPYKFDVASKHKHLSNNSGSRGDARKLSHGIKFTEHRLHTSNAIKTRTRKMQLSQVTILLCYLTLPVVGLPLTNKMDSSSSSMSEVKVEDFVHHIILSDPPPTKKAQKKKSKKGCVRRRRRKCAMRMREGEERRHCRYYVEIICKCGGKGRRGRFVIQNEWTLFAELFQPVLLF